MKNKILSVTLSLMAYFSVVSQPSSHERDSVAQTASFQIKVKMAAHKAAGNILADTLSLDRVRQYAQIVISEPNGGWLLALSYQCMTNPVIGANSSDNDMEFVVNSVFYKTAFAYYREEQPTPYLQAILKREKEKRRRVEDEERDAALSVKAEAKKTKQ